MNGGTFFEGERDAIGVEGTVEKGGDEGEGPTATHNLFEVVPRTDIVGVDVQEVFHAGLPDVHAEELGADQIGAEHEDRRRRDEDGGADKLPQRYESKHERQMGHEDHPHVARSHAAQVVPHESPIPTKTLININFFSRQYRKEYNIIDM